MEVIDTAGQEEFMLFRDTAMAQGDAYLALFAIDSVSSWKELKELRSKIIREHDDDETIPIVIIANKKASSFICPEGISILIIVYVAPSPIRVFVVG